MEQAPSALKYHTTQQELSKSLTTRMDTTSNASLPYNQPTANILSSDPTQLMTSEFPPLPNYQQQE
jgi:hypothetical protein